MMKPLADTSSQCNRTPGCALYRTVRAELILKGTTLNALCQSAGISRQYAYQCLVGKRHGKSASDVIERLIKMVAL